MLTSTIFNSPRNMDRDRTAVDDVEHVRDRSASAARSVIEMISGRDRRGRIRDVDRRDPVTLLRQDFAQRHADHSSAAVTSTFICFLNAAAHEASARQAFR